MNKTQKKFEKYLSELIDGKHTPTLAVRNELIYDYTKLLKKEPVTTIRQDVHDIFEKFGFNVEEHGIGWKISLPKTAKKTTSQCR